MSVVGLVLVAGGVFLIAFGWTRARGPWARYRALKAQDENIARYEAWRGGLRDESKTGASVAMEILRRQARIGFLIAARRGRPGGGGLPRPLTAVALIAARWRRAALSRRAAGGARSRCSGP